MGSDNTGSTSTKTDTAAQERGDLGSAKHQFNGGTGSSLSDTKENLVTVASDTVNTVKEMLLEGVPAAAEALQSAEERIRSLASGNEDNNEQAPDENMESHAQDVERIDQMDTEQICDFLRDKHRSTKPPPSIN
ncbi:uncharacterized protein N7498_006513 [Penicillium cinerascens]|uniref:Uncharacterized protein n=1 Tax=Penicillium cinerascens TaxID=70096 RepID=A0A9W9MIE0_9EURO|nr:uncharacterized protein N7498_006513 [Penicillium cinerascens]KAJ5201850.1 hypothetical protein N7498_006513 [Penicillium cinerascens]